MYNIYTLATEEELIYLYITKNKKQKTKKIELRLVKKKSFPVLEKAARLKIILEPG